MAEAVGLALGMAGLAGSFKGCIDVFTYFSSAQTLGKDYVILTTKFEIERTLLLQWAERVRLLHSDPDARFEEEAKRDAVSSILGTIKVLLDDGAELKKKYGLREEYIKATEKKDLQELGLTPLAASVGCAQVQRFANDFKSFSTQMSRAEREFRWVIDRRDKFEALVQDLAHLVTKLNDLMPDLAIIRAVWFRMMDDRRDRVAPRHARTLEWAFHPPEEDGVGRWDGLAAWLGSASTRYWVSGRAGSGKSTLMKCLCSESRVFEFLRQWAGAHALTVGSFFFWNLGTQEQKTQRGLLRAVLHCVISSNPPMIPKLLPRMWREVYGYDGRTRHTEDIDPPSDAELAIALDALPDSLKDRPLRFCFFIDGLDEYEGDYQNGIDFLNKLSRSPQIKIMVSSRPIPPCVTAFSTWPKLRLQELNSRDILQYIDDTLGSHPRTEVLRRRDPSGIAEIMQKLMARANGVFLWVVLACRSLHDGFDSCDQINELHARIEELPLELEDMFKHMLEKVSLRYREEAAKILRLAHHHEVHRRSVGGESSIAALPLALLDQVGLDPRQTGFTAMDLREKSAVCMEFEGRLRSRTGGLLELSVPSRCAGRLVQQTTTGSGGPRSG
ncbi:Prion-inhibition and propagation domain containing protein [Rhypophila decipiens]